MAAEPNTDKVSDSKKDSVSDPKEEVVHGAEERESVLPGHENEAVQRVDGE